MAATSETIRTTARLVFDLSRNGETTTRTIDIPSPLTDTSEGEALTRIQTAVNNAKTRYVDSSMNTFIQTANWRDTNISDEQWRTIGLRYEIITTTTQVVEPD